MKIHTKHYDRLAAAVGELDTESVRDAYRRRDIPNGDRVQDIDKRYQWDLYSAAVRRIGWDFQDELYAYLNDTHIATALRSIVPAL